MAAQLAQPPWLNPDDACTIAELVEDLRDIGRWSGLEGEELALAHVAAAAEALSAGLAPAERLPAVARLGAAPIRARASEETDDARWARVAARGRGMTDHNGLVIRVRDAAARREAGHMSRADIDRIDRFRAALTGLGDDAEMVGRILTARFGAAALALRELQRQLETGPMAWDVLPKLSVTLYGVARSAATAASTR